MILDVSGSLEACLDICALISTVLVCVSLLTPPLEYP